MRHFALLSFRVSALVASAACIALSLVSLVSLVAGCSSSSSTPQAPEPDGGYNAQPDANPTPVSTLDSATPVVIDSSVADTGSPNSTGDAAACELPTGGPTTSQTCNACLQTNCCSAVLTCLNDTACLDFNNCLANCQQGELPNDGGTFNTSTDGGVASCETTCATGVSTTVQQELEAQEACINTGGACVTACQ